jgi:uncharacterized membrane protein
MIKTKKMVLSGLFIAMSVIGSLIKVQGSIAFDSMPGFLAALLIGPIEGFMVAALGHMASAWSSGFGLSLPIHLIIALEMGVISLIFGIVYKKINWITAIILAIFLNGVISPLTLVPLFGWGFFGAIVWILLSAAAANVILAYMVYKLIKGRV